MATPPALSSAHYLTVDEAAEILNIHRKTLYDACKKKPSEPGYFPSVKVGRTVRISRKIIEQLSNPDA